MGVRVRMRMGMMRMGLSGWSSRKPRGRFHGIMERRPVASSRVMHGGDGGVEIDVI